MAGSRKTSGSLIYAKPPSKGELMRVSASSTRRSAFGRAPGWIRINDSEATIARAMLRCRTRRASPWGYTDDHVPETEFAVDSPLEGAGFEPSVPLWVLTVSGPPSVVSVTLPPLSLRQNGNTLSRPGTGSPSGGESAAKLASVSLRDTRISAGYRQNARPRVRRPSTPV